MRKKITARDIKVFLLALFIFFILFKLDLKEVKKGYNSTMDYLQSSAPCPCPDHQLSTDSL